MHFGNMTYKDTSCRPNMEFWIQFLTPSLGDDYPVIVSHNKGSCMGCWTAKMVRELLSAALVFRA